MPVCLDVILSTFVVVCLLPLSLSCRLVLQRLMSEEGDESLLGFDAEDGVRSEVSSPQRVCTGIPVLLLSKTQPGSPTTVGSNLWVPDISATKTTK